MSAPVVVIRSVWAWNFVPEMELLRSLVDKYPYVAIDTEYPGVYFDIPTPHYLRTPEEQYAVVKSNVDSLNLIQLGLTLCDADGNMPDLGTNGSTRYAWELNFCDFDLWRDLSVPESVKLLQESGIDLWRTRAHGIPTRWLGTAGPFVGSRSWITFHGCYDVAYLMKAVTGKKLPETLEGFLAEAKRIFGDVYDMKSMIVRCCSGLHGGLEQVAKMLNVERAAGRSHQAGSDSLVIGSTFVRLKNLYFPDTDLAKNHAGRLYGFDYIAR